MGDSASLAEQIIHKRTVDRPSGVNIQPNAETHVLKHLPVEVGLCVYRLPGVHGELFTTSSREQRHRLHVRSNPSWSSRRGENFRPKSQSLKMHSEPPHRNTTFGNMRQVGPGSILNEALPVGIRKYDCRPPRGRCLVLTFVLSYAAERYQFTLSSLTRLIDKVNECFHGARFHEGHNSPNATVFGILREAVTPGPT